MLSGSGATPKRSRWASKKPMISSVDFPFRAISTSPLETSEIAGFAPHTWYRIREADHAIKTYVARSDVAFMNLATRGYHVELRVGQALRFSKQLRSSA